MEVPDPQGRRPHAARPERQTYTPGYVFEHEPDLPRRTGIRSIKPRRRGPAGFQQALVDLGLVGDPPAVAVLVPTPSGPVFAEQLSPAAVRQAAGHDFAGKGALVVIRPAREDRYGSGR